VRAVGESDAPWAALGPRGAAERYGCRVLREEVDDEPGNETRFVWLGAAGSEPVASDGAGAWKTSVVFAGAGDAQPGWLVRCLSEFAFRGVNLTKIESRPRRGRLGHYLFHVDMEGRTGESSVDDAVQALHAHCEEVRLLGTYPAA
jgi:prephenate dehydratase